MAVGFIGVDVDVLDFIEATLLLIISGGTAYLLAQKFGTQYGRLFQGLMIGALGLLTGSPMALVYGFIATLLGITDAVAVEDSSLAFLDPSLA